jgi:Putative peptidoglycan binding domain.
VAGLHVGGKSAEPARAAIEAAFMRPVTVAYDGRQTPIRLSQVGAKIDVNAAVGSALAATPHSRIALPVTYSQARVARIVDRLAKQVDRPAIDASVIGATAAGPEFTAARPGLAVDNRTMRAAVGQLLRDGTRAPLQLLTHSVPSQRTIAAFGPVIVVTRGANTLRLYDSQNWSHLPGRDRAGDLPHPLPASGGS